EALESGRPVLLEYIDGFGSRTERIVQPLHVRRRGGQLMLIAHCQLRNDQRTFKLDRVVRMVQMDMPPLVIPPRIKKRAGARIYDTPPSAAQIYDDPKPVQFISLTHNLDLPIQTPETPLLLPFDLTIEANPS
ncbi:MAG TPA: WYL domain-containing protein, partial [Tepidisphaeraceae bacterium]|nr:WYL domain-containing protein [Tepidisphaeraceae bacterium]